MIKTLFVISLLCCYSSTYAHDVIVQINGIISESGCVVDSNSREFSVNLGSVASGDFTSGKTTSKLIPFSLFLRDCSSLSSGVKITFRGESDLSNPSLLRLTDTEHSAQGIAIEILDKDKTSLALNSSSVRYSLTPNADAELNFFSRYKATSGVQPGIANATATFNLEYD
ncbi:fimbrial protein [Pantoea ananatis]|uniref:fimbrial protein n=1 Tax=Pantoea ananas TaxID=553 RepID=UPI0009BCEB1F|nr:fimbrial protein [Pantoea ananatis]MCW0313686.1 Protein FimF [Pantoea ananatis]UYL02106.1 fimbrial protein [Pantoea ananatis]